MTIRNPILATDSYKMSHFQQYPEGSEFVTSYVTARGSKMGDIDGVVFFGLQAFIKDFLLKPITQANIAQAMYFCEVHGVPFNHDGWSIILNEHGGYIPVEIQAQDEGSVLPFGVPYLTVKNTDPRLPWVTSWLESVMLSYIWYASTVATKSREIKRVIQRYLAKTSSDEASADFKLHDFGFRGAAPGAADIGGMAHLVNFKGTDTMQGIEAALHYYPNFAYGGNEFPGFSINASEHSTTTSWGRENEFAFYKHMVDTNKGRMFSVVIDSYDTAAALDMWLRVQPGETKTLYQQVKENGSVAVMRPDSGDPVKMPISVVNYLYTHLPTDEVMIGSKGYAVLPDYARVIQGDGIDKEDIENILAGLEEMGYSADNIAFGMGGGLLQKVNRDTLKFAMKACAITINGEDRDVVKDPVTDPGKKSLAGHHITVKDKEGKYVAIRVEDVNDYAHDHGGWETVYYHAGDVASPFFRQISFNEVRKNAEIK